MPENIQLPTGAVIQRDHRVEPDVEKLGAAVAGLGLVIQASTDGDDVVTDVSVAAVQDVTATDGFTLANPTGAVNGKSFLWRILNDSDSAITPQVGDQFVFGGAVPEIPEIPAGSILYLFAKCCTLGGTAMHLLAADVFAS